ncbi:hypothetical protein [Roseomonas xinghualingensis]|uniref:hypothetical protein n=1 Tax=Roseomonas xinghualingensis TaxID=2986475 RepID=UPI0021F17C33|nr:hypothetical protein [Roseomonas sp. SXEYE001]MCV4209904.1 hypothetical protein [Roseomonas sp. SXEYE001]
MRRRNLVDVEAASAAQFATQNAFTKSRGDYILAAGKMNGGRTRRSLARGKRLVAGTI